MDRPRCRGYTLLVIIGDRSVPTTIWLLHRSNVEPVIHEATGALRNIIVDAQSILHHALSCARGHPRVSAPVRRRRRGSARMGLRACAFRLRAAGSAGFSRPRPVLPRLKAATVPTAPSARDQSLRRVQARCVFALGSCTPAPAVMCTCMAGPTPAVALLAAWPVGSRYRYLRIRKPSAFVACAR